MAGKLELLRAGRVDPEDACSFVLFVVFVRVLDGDVGFPEERKLFSANESQPLGTISVSSYPKPDSPSRTTFSTLWNASSSFARMFPLGAKFFSLAIGAKKVGIRSRLNGFEERVATGVAIKPSDHNSLMDHNHKKRQKRNLIQSEATEKRQLKSLYIPGSTIVMLSTSFAIPLITCATRL